MTMVPVVLVLVLLYGVEHGSAGHVFWPQILLEATTVDQLVAGVHGLVPGRAGVCAGASEGARASERGRRG